MHLGFTVQTLIKMTVQSSAGVTKSTLSIIKPHFHSKVKS